MTATSTLTVHILQNVNELVSGTGTNYNDYIYHFSAEFIIQQ